MNLEGGSSKTNSLLNASVYLKEMGKYSFWGLLYESNRFILNYWN